MPLISWRSSCLFLRAYPGEEEHVPDLLEVELLILSPVAVTGGQVNDT